MQIARPVLLACFFAACGATTDKATCFDGEKNGTETDIDCGGGACGRCFDGKACTLPSDCMSALCTGGRCGGFLPGGGGGSTGGGGGGSTGGGGGGSTGGGGGGATGGGGGATGGGGGATGGGGGATGGGGGSTGGGGGSTGGGGGALGGGGGSTGGGGGAIGGGGGSTGGGGGSTGGGGGATGTVLLISQVQTRGEAGGNDEFVELYNPSTTLSVVFDSTWTLSVRAATSCASTEGTRYTGAGQLIGPRRHLLLTNSGGYNGSVAGDATYTTAIGDAASVVLRREQTVVDAVCLAADSATMTSLTTCTPTFLCEGTPVMNPHDNTTATNTDMAVLRVNGADTQNNAADFAAMASAPRNLAVP